MQLFSMLDLIALTCFIGAWIGYALAAEHTSRGKTGLNAKMNTYRAIWMRRMLDRDVRIIDAQIMAASMPRKIIGYNVVVIPIGIVFPTRSRRAEEKS